MKHKFTYTAVLLLIVAISAAFTYQQRTKAPAVAADKIFINGVILTVDAKNSVAQAVAIKNGKILLVGTNKAINLLKDKNTTVVDLQGRTLVPGFIDGHSHFMSLQRATAVDLSPPPVGGVKSIADIVAALQKFKAEHQVKPGEWISGYGYDQDQLKEGRHPVKEDLDAAFPDNPVVLSHVSGHMVVANSAAFKASGIDSSTPNPAGGMIVRKPGTNEPAGLLQEHASGLLKRSRGNGDAKKPTLDDQIKLIKDQELFYASNGITTAQEGHTAYAAIQLLKAAADKKALFIDIASLASYESIDRLLKDSVHFGQYHNGLKLEGFKLIADGSPQGKTAFFSEPYLTPVPGCDGDDCHGIPTVTQEQFNAAIIKGYQNNIQTFVHCNGDSTIGMYIKAVENASKVLHTSSVGRRSVIIHSQFVRSDQLDSYKKLGMIPSFFTNHTFFWGDVHVRNLGQARAFFSSPTKTALDKGLIFTDHTDYGVTPLSQLFVIWSAVNRLSRSGQVIGPDQRLTAAEALRTVTINGAYQYFEEKTKGSIEKGKLADFVILSDNITTIDPVKIKDITVLETIKEGKTIYKKQ